MSDLVSVRSGSKNLGCVAAALLLGLSLWVASPVGAEEFIAGKPSGQVLTAGDRRVLVLSSTGEVLWEYPTKLTHDVWMLPNGNVLFADGETVTEATAEKKVVFLYRPANQQGGGAYACQRLANEVTLVGENSTGRVLELNRDGKVVFTLQTSPCQPGQHHNMRMARKLENGNYLVCHSGARVVKEYTPKGDVVWEVKVPGPLAFAALRTAQDTTLVSSLDQVTEYDRAGQVVWQCSTADLGGAEVRNLTGIQRLANGHVVAGCYQAYKDGRGCGLIEISPDKKLVWGYANPQGDHTMMPVQLLSPAGKALPEPCRR